MAMARKLIVVRSRLIGCLSTRPLSTGLSATPRPTGSNASCKITLAFPRASGTTASREARSASGGRGPPSGSAARIVGARLSSDRTRIGQACRDSEEAGGGPTTPPWLLVWGGPALGTAGSRGGGGGGGGGLRGGGGGG